MDRMKTFAKYVIWIILFWIFSDILINIGINSTYKDIKANAQIPNGIQVEQVQATAVNGRIKIKVDSSLSGKYIKLNLYSKNDNILGTQYIEIGKIEENQLKDIETYFKISEVNSYNIEITDEMGKSTEGFMDTALSTLTILVMAIKLFII